MPGEPCLNTLHVADPQLSAHFDKSQTTVSKLSQCIMREKIENSNNQEKIPSSMGTNVAPIISSQPSFLKLSLFPPAGATLNATACQTTGTTVASFSHKKKIATKKYRFSLLPLTQLLDSILSRKFRFSVSFLSPTSP